MKEGRKKCDQLAREYYGKEEVSLEKGGWNPVPHSGENGQQKKELEVSFC